MFYKLIILLALLLMELGVTIYFFVKKRIKWYIAAGIGLMLVTMALLFCTLPASRVFFNVPAYTANGAAEKFCTAAVSLDRDSEQSLLKEESTLYPTVECQDEAAEKLRKFVLSNMDLTITEKPKLGWSRSTAKLKLTYPDISALKDKLIEDTVKAAEEIGAQRPRSLVYTADKNYKSEIIDEAYNAELDKLSEESCPALSSEIELTLVCEKGQWLIVSDKTVTAELVKGLSDTATLTEALEAFAAEQKQLVSETAAYVEKHFTIDFDDTVAPEPDSSRYGATTDPAVVSDIVEKASDLLKGETLVWSPDIEIYPGTEIHYYFDDSILAIVWREERNGTLCTFAEIKLADASQLKRKLVDDMFDPPTSDWKEATILSDEVNAVIATGSDLYAFRDVGIFSHDGVLYRCNTSSVESCHITRSGDMLFTKRYELRNWDEAQEWITDNDIMYSFAFGPRLIENGEPITTWEYSVGEIWEGYARAAMGQMGDKGSLHYLMSVVSSDERVSVAEKPVMRNPTLLDLRNIMVEKGCTQAYTMDGGQTGAIIIDNEMINRPTYGWERIYCDILYFATAITPEERLG